MSAGWVVLLSPLILDLPCSLAFSEGPGQTLVVSVGGEYAEQRRHISSVALYADGLVKQSHTSLQVSLSFCVCLSF